MKCGWVLVATGGLWGWLWAETADSPTVVATRRYFWIEAAVAIPYAGSGCVPSANDRTSIVGPMCRHVRILCSLA